MLGEFLRFVTEPANMLATLALALLVAGFLSGTLRTLRILALLAALAAAVHFAILRPDGTALVIVLLLLFANLVQLALMLARARSGMTRREERELVQLILKVEDPKNQNRLLDLLEWRDVEEGETLMEQGQAQPPFIYIASGEAAVLHDGQNVGSAGVGDFLGEMSLVSGARASATVTASKPMRIARFDRDGLLRLSHGMPEIGRAFDLALNRGMAAKIARMNEAAARVAE